VQTPKAGRQPGEVAATCSAAQRAVGRVASSRSVQRRGGSEATGAPLNAQAEARATGKSQAS
jgi:hypothetical protein